MAARRVLTKQSIQLDNPQSGRISRGFAITGVSGSNPNPFHAFPRPQPQSHIRTLTCVSLK